LHGRGRCRLTRHGDKGKELQRRGGCCARKHGNADR
jgi:hypothetical protein